MGQKISIVPFNAPSRKFMNDQILLEKIKTLIDKGPYLDGPAVENFERSFASFLGAKHCLGVSSGTSALDLAINGLGIPNRSEILLNAHAGGYGSIAIKKNNMTAVYFEIKSDATPDYESFKELVTEKTKALILTNLYGQSNDIQEILDYCRSRNMYVIEDCAQSIGAYYPNSTSRAGSKSDISTFSFYPTKNFSTFGDAGAVVTSNTDIYERIKSLREYGWKNKYFAENSGGSNYRMDEIHAVVLNHNLSNVDSNNLKRKNIWNCYRNSLHDKSVEILGCDAESFVAHLAVLKSENISLIKKKLNFAGIETKIHYPYVDYNQPAFSEFKKLQLKISEVHCKSILSIPLFAELSNAEVELISNTLRSL